MAFVGSDDRRTSVNSAGFAADGGSSLMLVHEKVGYSPQNRFAKYIPT